MDQRQLGRNGPLVCPLGFGAFKIGRNQQIKYSAHYELPDEQAVSALLNGVLDLGINYIDTAPAYGLSEERIGRAIGSRRHEFTLSSKVGEDFAEGRSSYDYSRSAVEQSVARSLRRLKTDVLDLVLVHSNGDDLTILNETDVVPTLEQLKASGAIRGIGFSGKTVPGATAALSWADCIMVEYHQDDRSHEEVIAQAAAAEIGVVVKKGLASGRLPAREALRFVLANQGVTAVVVGTLNVDHIRANLAALG